jgi:hypothetical protein
VDATVIASAMHRDKGAAWAGHKRRKAIHGFKAHVAADADTALVEELTVTPGNVNDRRAGGEVLPDDPGDVYADSAYRGTAFASAVQSKGGSQRVVQTGVWGRPGAQHQFDEARDHCRTALALNPHDGWARAEMFRICMLLLRVDWAYNHLAAWIRLNNPAAVARGQSMNVFQSDMCQVYGEFALNRDLIEQLVQIRALAPEDRIAPLPSLVRWRRCFQMIGHSWIAKQRANRTEAGKSSI